MDVEVDRIARVQHGVITRKQLLKLMSARQVDVRVKRKDLIRVRRGVYRLRGAPITWHQVLMAAVLSKGGVAKGMAAGRLWDLPGCEYAFVNVLVTRNKSHRMAGDGLSSSGTTTQTDQKRCGIPVTGVERTIIELSEYMDHAELGAALDDAIQRNLTSVARVSEVLEEMGSVGRKKTRRVKRVLQDRRDTRIEQTRWVHRRVARLLIAAGIDDFVVEHPIRPGQTDRFLDIAWPQHMLAIEVDGYSVHADRTAFDKDRIRTSEVTATGWTILPVTAKMSDEFILDCVRKSIDLATKSPA